MRCPRETRERPAIGLGRPVRGRRTRLHPGARHVALGGRHPIGPTSDFLDADRGVALLAGAGFLWALRAGTAHQTRIALVALAGYYVIGSLVDLGAFRPGIVGAASMPSAVVRVAIGVLCVVAALRLREA